MPCYAAERKVVVTTPTELSQSSVLEIMPVEDYEEIEAA